MDIDKLFADIRSLGYDRDDVLSSTTHNRETIGDDYSRKTISHAIMKLCKMVNANFDYAAATGSLYESCDFINCSMHQSDFEFCTFTECEFTADKTVVSSFNNCNFSGVRFSDVNFESCTFTGATFENCIFDNVGIENSTLENALFYECTFKHMELRSLNMDYVQLENVKMKKVVLPFSQIPYMFGCLEYLKDTTDYVLISAGSNKCMKPEEYFSRAIPEMIKYWKAKSPERSEFYFPLSNAYIVMRDYANALESLRNGLQAAVIAKDYRMIKFYCRLISRSNLFGHSTAHKFYDLIKKFAPKGKMNSPEMRSFMRNIGEIKSTLFSSVQKPSLTIQFRTNMHMSETEKIGPLISRLFSIAKMPKSIDPNIVELTLSENSPMLISIKASGNEDNITDLLPIFLHMAGFQTEEIQRLCPAYFSPSATGRKESTTQLDAEVFVSECAGLGIRIGIIEFCVENCPSANLPADTYYMNFSGSTWNDYLFLE